MSEPLTSHEIEDVLSSIRRLVSDDLRPASRAAAGAAPAPKPAAAEAGKLMLTPALRVVPESADPASDPALAAADGGLAPAVDSYDDEGPGAATYDPALLKDGFAPEAGDSPVAEPADEALLTGEPEEAEETVFVDEGHDDLIWSSPGVVPEAEMTEDLLPEEAAPSEEPPLREAHGHWTAQDVPGMDWAQEEADWVEPEPMPFVAHPRKSAMASDPLARAWADRAEAEVRANLTEAATGDGAEAETPRATIQEPKPEPAAAAPKEDVGQGMFDGDLSEIDEEVLRDIVRDIIREELAGTLGERITRNVRKLVRVEINRALTAREFE